MGRTVVELFCDVVSPYSWLGFEVLCRYQHIWNIVLHFRPAFLGGIMQATGTPGAMRFITAIDMTQPRYLESLSREFWIRFWSQVAGQAGLSSEVAQKHLEMISSPAVKNRLKETTEEAIKYGAFGCLLLWHILMGNLISFLAPIV